MYFLGNNREVDVLVKALIRTILCLTVVLLLATNAIAQGSQLTLGPDLSYQQAISLEKGQAYELSFNLISDRSQSKAEVSIIFYQGIIVKLKRILYRPFKCFQPRNRFYVFFQQIFYVGPDHPFQFRIQLFWHFKTADGSVITVLQQSENL